MNRHPDVLDRSESEGVLLSPAAERTEPVTSPFAGGARFSTVTGSPGIDREDSGRAPSQWLASPFTEALTAVGRSESEEALGALAAELWDEGFDEALQSLTDEAAGRHLEAATAWSSERSGRSGGGELEAWMSGIATEADALLEHLQHHFATRTPESLSEGEVEAVFSEALAAQGHPGVEGEEFFGALLRKVGSLAKGAASLARRGIAAAGGLLLGPLFGAVRGLVRPLLARVLAVAMNKIPLRYRKDAVSLAGKLGISLPSEVTTMAAAAPVTAGAALAELFDTQLAEVVASGGHARAEGEQDGPMEREAVGDESEVDGPIAHLDDARAELAQQITEAEPGSVLTAEMEQFLPVVMAALPVIRTGIRVLGRGKVVAFLAQPLAELIKGHVGPEATQALSRAIADKGLGLLGLEAEAGMRGPLGAEALVSTVEDTIRAVGELPSDSVMEPLRLRAELQEVFAAAAARHLPGELLRPDLEVSEADGESTVWVLMPRGPRRRYRYRKCSRVFPASIGRQVARAIVLRDGGTLEDRLLDEGATGWPVDASVHLYETVPGTHLGHLAAAEDVRLESGALDTSEFEELTPSTAGLLLNHPGLGRRAGRAAGVGQRYYRVVLPRRAAMPAHRNARVVVRLLLTGRQPVLRVHLRLGERGAHRVTELLAQRKDVQLVAAFRSRILGLAERSLPAGLLRQAQRVPGVVLTPDAAESLAKAVGERMITAVAAQLPAMAPALAAAARDAAPGVTLTFQFVFADRAALAAGRPDATALTVRPGRHRD